MCCCWSVLLVPAAESKLESDWRMVRVLAKRSVSPRVVDQLEIFLSYNDVV